MRELLIIAGVVVVGIGLARGIYTTHSNFNRAKSIEEAYEEEKVLDERIELIVQKNSRFLYLREEK